jgi:hypothetical protein
MKYYLTVRRNGELVVSRLPFDDYADAIQFLTRYYQLKIPGARAVFELVTEVINGSFARSYGTLRSSDDPGAKSNTGMLDIARTHELLFTFDGSYRFIIESEFGVREGDALRSEAQADGE